MKMHLVRDGRQLDTVTVDGERITYRTGRARPVIEAEAERGRRPADLVGTSNGHIAWEPGPPHDTWATWAGADVLATLPDLPPA
jgi:hypothetical protein